MHVGSGVHRHLDPSHCNEVRALYRDYHYVIYGTKAISLIIIRMCRADSVGGNGSHLTRSSESRIMSGFFLSIIPRRQATMVFVCGITYFVGYVGPCDARYFCPARTPATYPGTPGSELALPPTTTGIGGHTLESLGNEDTTMLIKRSLTAWGGSLKLTFRIKGASTALKF